MAGRSSIYRADIDGLRAIAVVAIVLYHLKFHYLAGGFIGVDIFFVISGYLITKHVYDEINAGIFSLGAFYDRRIRRIFPALVAMLCVSSIFAYLLLWPQEMVDYAKSMVSSIFSFSNIYFWKTADYFSSGEKPLIHTWSLAVEEQFYIFLPPLLLVLRNSSRAMRHGAIALTAIGSFVLSAITIARYPEATFYLLPTRAWELLLGGMLGIGMIPAVSGRIRREFAAGIGLLIILVSAVTYKAYYPFPGPIALLPCLGALMVIGSGGEELTLVAKLLSTPPFVGIGLISYSLYLWHVPVIAFQQCIPSWNGEALLAKLLPFLSMPQIVTANRCIVSLTVSLSMAVLSWRFIERPFRYGQWRPNRQTLFAQAAICCTGLAILGVAVIAGNGLAYRFSARAVKVASYTKASEMRRGSCFATGREPFDLNTCLHEDPSRKNWLVMGDSHAAMLVRGLADYDPDVNVMQATHTGCKPVIEKRFSEDSACIQLMHYVYDDFLHAHHPDTVILAGNWQEYDISRIADTIRFLKDRHQSIVLVGPIVQYDTPLPRLLATAVESNEPSLPTSHRIVFYEDLDRKMQELAKDTWHVQYISYRNLLCPAEQCTVWSGSDTPLQSDSSHLTDEGSRFVAFHLKSAGQLNF